MNRIALLLRGLPNSGKTTTAALLRNKLTPAVRISNDSVRYMAQPRDFSAFTIEASELGCLDLAISYLDSGFTPVIDGVFEDTDFLDAQQLRFRRKGLRLVTVTLTGGLDDLMDRNSSRDPLARMDEDRMRELHAQFRPGGLLLDIDGKQPEEVADDVLDLLALTSQDEEVAAAAIDADVLFLRHGAPDYPQGVYPDPYGMGLSARGRDEARAARHAVKRFVPHVVYTSDFLRAEETAMLAAGSLGLDIRRDAALRERVFHTLTGTELAEVRILLGEEADRVLNGNSDFCEHGDEEAYEQARERVLTFFGKLAALHAGQRVLVVGHGGPHAWLMEKALGVQMRGMRRMRWDTGHFSRFRVGPDTVSVDFMNRSPEDIAHSLRPVKEEP
ncbi:histidine phosphatase family protein [Streptomyces sp. AM 4-1-1]|uniref:histidine phosphatase family protein n=1 Tax=Streptomyces sp. AM 4-1-1 TaxID=3028710 RepID=UPI0023B8E6BB|nr:histidine phosphatase family protein [Streptomyces sp. AM 4-1-1]WEH36594.1 histidine phosphatase family protein [Streptomyces sp. AM 4-1-1]